MLRRELLKSLAGLAVLPLAALAPKYATGSLMSRQEWKTRNFARTYGRPRWCNYSVQATEEAERLKNWAALRDVIVTTEMRGGKLEIISVVPA